MTLGEIVAEKLRNPAQQTIDKSEFLLLRTIAEHGPVSEDDICERLDQEREKDFIFMFGGHQPRTLHDKLMGYYAIGIIEIKDWKDEEPCYSLTVSGKKVLNNYAKTIL